MHQPKATPKPIELRDESGRLYGKLIADRLEFKRDGKIVIFDKHTGKQVRVDNGEIAR